MSVGKRYLSVGPRYGKKLYPLFRRMEINPFANILIFLKNSTTSRLQADERKLINLPLCSLPQLVTWMECFLSPSMFVVVWESEWIHPIAGDSLESR